MKFWSVWAECSLEGIYMTEEEAIRHILGDRDYENGPYDEDTCSCNYNLIKKTYRYGFYNIRTFEYEGVLKRGDVVHLVTTGDYNENCLGCFTDKEKAIDFAIEEIKANTDRVLDVEKIRDVFNELDFCEDYEIVTTTVR